MVSVRIASENKSIEKSAAAQFLTDNGLAYQFIPLRDDTEEMTPDEILRLYKKEIDELKAKGNYAEADVVDVRPETEGLDEMLVKFQSEHTHEEDEVRYVTKGRGLFHIHTEDDKVIAIELEPGDLISVPKGTKHWFNLCSERRVRMIRLFQDTRGWVAIYTQSNVHSLYQPMCFGQVSTIGSNERTVHHQLKSSS